MRKVVLVCICVLGLLIRVFGLSNYPAGFTPDEAAFGYNAYSLLLTGRDEWGQPWYELFFINLRSFGDYKLPLYAYLAVPTVKIFGLTEFATRLPNAIFGSLAIAAIYLLARKFMRGELFPLLASFILAISPWHIQLSRGAFEANLATLFIPLAIYLFLSQRLALSTLYFALSFYSYHSARILTPVILALLWWYKPVRLTAHKSFPILLLLFIPGLWSFFGPRVADVSILSPTDNWHSVATDRFVARNLGLPDFVARTFSNKATNVLSQFVHNYLVYFSPSSLFATGPAEATYGMLPGLGLLYLIELPLLGVFLTQFIRRPTRSQLLLILLLGLAPVPAALSKSSGFAANRAAIMTPFFVLAAAIGFVQIWSRKKIIFFIAGAYLVSLAYFGFRYIYLAPSVNGPAMSYGWRQAISRGLPISDRFTDVRVSRIFSESHIFLAFYSAYPPKEYQKESTAWLDFEAKGLRFLDQLDGYYLGKFRFGDLKFSEPVTRPTLFIGPPSQFPENYPEYFHVDYPNGTPAIKIAEKTP
ncbi:hypothetical protein A2634_04925 [Candidatus Amesbacteria bacterium RIFCSPHIGHO2_01_FULL_48_32]|uniref:Glycosyltransferase RgtA/B/C/D-like domain-containing protein n=1 Tax=Candidatus Amesbacteria bacterium RIFCSPLOWO2_01_FULL_48_25 TaxID=1797259 RepID=A0A1F4ZCM2_9BACT|nr:MAG: hypothetical protein A2634_04925 [Candidatus Amesbacteria bacterium RIFCSPHIGHO2_01_FULL_48_32]OGD04011.1 MAG: hypothetical protein A2989_01275 [Candidatus Amesbacteria bacterium RIFCSPLOWO2_01_FULL_48_25]HJZ05725.1 glycosyltransferase family 39 protein [Patescibacteria group bacterium]